MTKVGTVIEYSLSKNKTMVYGRFRPAEKSCRPGTAMIISRMQDVYKERKICKKASSKAARLSTITGEHIVAGVWSWWPFNEDKEIEESTDTRCASGVEDREPDLGLYHPAGEGGEVSEEEIADWQAALVKAKDLSLAETVGGAVGTITSVGWPYSTQWRGWYPTKKKGGRPLANKMDELYFVRKPKKLVTKAIFLQARKEIDNAEQQDQRNLRRSGRTDQGSTLAAQ